MRLWDVATGQEKHTLTGHTSSVSWVAFSPDGLTLAQALSYDQTVMLWDSETGQERNTLTGHNAGLTWSGVFAGWGDAGKC